MRYEGVVPTIVRRYHQTHSESVRQHYRAFMTAQPCEACGQKRLRPESLSVRAFDRSISEVTDMTIGAAHEHFTSVRMSEAQQRIAEGALREVTSRLEFLLNVGLDYLTLGRAGPSLSGGEAQRIRLASQLGSELSGVIYVLDEPSVGLHQRDNRKLIDTLRHLRDLGNTVIVVEHDEETIRSADHVVDFGPGAGEQGGRVVFDGSPQDLERHPASITGAYLSGRLTIEHPRTRRTPKGELWVRGAAEHNLKDIDVRFPLGVLVAVTGVSGAGKSSLVNGILRPALARHLHRSTDPVGKHRRIEGLEAIGNVVSIDQQPIGRTPRSNPGTYTKAFDEIRAVFAQVPDARARGYSAGRFSFNVEGGRCESCGGDGVVKVEMHFLPAVYVVCEACRGRRYGAQTLSIRFKNLSIADVLDLSVDECLELFCHHPTLARILTTLKDVGLGYMKVGQPAPTLSGGEAQRVKLSRELAKTQAGRTLYILDEPTTGLHFDDTRKLLGVLGRLVDAGNTVIVVEHNLDVIRCADYVVDLGQGGGDSGGRLIASGTPEEVASSPDSYTGLFLGPLLSKRARGK
jgi:excinuclease ABC subunit A